MSFKRGSLCICFKAIAVIANDKYHEIGYSCMPTPLTCPFNVVNLSLSRMITSPSPIQGTRSRWQRYGQQVLHWKRAGSQRSKGGSESATDEGSLTSRMRAKAYHQQLSVEVKQQKEVRSRARGRRRPRPSSDVVFIFGSSLCVLMRVRVSASIRVRVRVRVRLGLAVGLTLGLGLGLAVGLGLALALGLALGLGLG